MAASEVGDVGIIVPPPKRKTIIDKTAAHVAKFGRHVEEDILNRSTGDNAANFTFLLENDFFHPYYLSKLEEYQRGTVQAAPASSTTVAEPPPSKPTENVPQNDSQQSSVVSRAPALKSTNLVDALVASNKRKGQDPSPFEFLVEKPNDITLEEAQLIKLTAQFAATDGKKFELDIYHQEKQNEEFAFLHANHHHHGYYTELVRAYRKLMDGNLGWINDLVKSESVLLERAIHRFDFRRSEALKRMETDEKRALERIAFLEVDWHDFVVVETIRFDDEDKATATENLEQALEIRSAFDAEEGMDIRRDYSVEPVRATIAVPMVSLPDGRSVPVSEMNEHMRVNLLDPRWRGNQDKFEVRQRDTNLAEGGSMQMNLRKLAGARPDVFGGGAEDAERRFNELEKKQEAKVVWDGNLLNADTFKAAAAARSAGSSTQIPSLLVPGQLPNIPPPNLPRPPIALGQVAPPPPPISSSIASNPYSGALPDAKRQRSIDDESQQSYKLIVPPGGPSGVSSGEILIPSQNHGTVSELKDMISSQLSNVAVSKFQLKLNDGRFLKNSDTLESIQPGTVIEIKWKLK